MDTKKSTLDSCLEIKKTDNYIVQRRKRPHLIQCVYIIIFAFTFFPKTHAQLPDLGTTIDFALFTKNGALGNTAVSTITGDIGTNDGAITGFGAPTVVNGSIELANSRTAQAAIDVQNAYNQLFSVTPTDASHLPAFGNSETLTPGVYSVGSAGSVAGNLSLDAEGDPNAIFIFQFAGALITGESATVNLLNEASACNVFWITEGEIAMAALTVMKGTLIASNGAVSMGEGGILEGRMLSTVGAANVYETTITIPICINSTLPIELLSFKGFCENQNIILEWKTASEVNNDFFTIEKSFNGLDWLIIGKVNGAGNSNLQQDYMFKDTTSYNEKLYYQLKQTDFNGDYTYESVISINKCKDFDATSFLFFPNPSKGIFNLLYDGNKNEINEINIFDTSGKHVYSSLNYQSTIDLSDKEPGLYYVRVMKNFEVIYLKIIVSN